MLRVVIDVWGKLWIDLWGGMIKGLGVVVGLYNGDLCVVLGMKRVVVMCCNICRVSEWV